MKKSILLLGFVFLSFTNLFGQTYYMTTPQGYGAGTTGGGSATPVTVTTQSALQSALTASGSGVILVSGTISCTYMSVLVSNKTLIGLPGARLRNLDQTASGSGIINIKPGSNNVIIRNLIFEGPGAYDVDGRDNLTVDGGSKIWVDHCEFQDGMDGNYDHKGLTDNVTVSWCKFTYLKAPKPGGSGGTDDHRFSDLVGSSDSDMPSDGQYSITWQCCWWAEGCVERMTRARNAQLNMVNCYWNSQVAKVALGLGGTTDCYVENSVFDNTGDKYRYYNNGTVRLTTVGCSAPPANVGTCPAPTYTHDVFAVGSVVSALTGPCGAGATLNVTSAGVISANSSCSAGTPTLVLTSGTASQSVSAGNAITNIIYTWGGNATDVTISGLPSGLTSVKNSGAKTITISGTPTATGTYTVTTVQSSGTAVSLSGTITVVPLVAPTLVLTSGTASQSVSTGSPITNIVYTWGGGATDVTVSGLPAGVTATKNTGAKTVTLSGTPTAAGIFNFSLVTVGGSSPMVTLSGTVTVTTPVVLAVPGNVTATSTSTAVTIDWNQVPNATGYVVNFCTTTGGGVVKNWAFPSTTLTAANADANLQVDGTNARFNYIPSTSNTELVFANGNPIPDVQGLKFTQAGTSKVRIGYDASSPYLYLNGTGIAITIPCTSGDKITVVGPSSNSTAIDRGFSMTGGTLNTSQSINVDGTGIMNVAGATGTWVYNATSSAVTITTVTGGMNIASITVSSGSGSTCSQYTVSGGANTIYTVTGLTPSTTYSYQVKAIDATPSETSPYSTSTNINTTAVGNASPVVSITSPVTNYCATVGATVAFTANATDADGTVSNVQFYNGATLLGAGVKSGNDYLYSWTNVAAGTYTITAIATDNLTASTTSTAITVKVSPAVSITGQGAGVINCTTTSITLSSNQAAGSYAWTRNGVAAGTGSTLGVTTAGTYGLTVTYANGCTATASMVTTTVDNSAPAAPTVTIPSPYCQNATASALTATGTALKWYTVSTGGTGSSTAITPSTTAIGTINYYVSQTTSNGCESPRSSIAVTVNAIPGTPTVSSQVSYCQNVTATALTATGTSLKWYTVSSGGTGSATAPTPVTITTGTTNYYVSQTMNNCESPRATIAVTVNAIPGAPSVISSVAYCQNATATALTANGTSLTWYTSSTGGTGSATAPVPSTTTLGSTNYYVSQTISGCEGARAAITVTINMAATATITAGGATSFCQGGSVILTANAGSSYIWFNGATQVGTNSSYTANSSGNYTVQITNPSGCTGQVTSSVTTVTVNALPAATITAGGSTTFCQGGSVTLTASAGSSYIWFNGATQVGTSASYTATTSGNYTVEVSNASNCKATSSATQVTVNALPAATITAGGSTTFCQGGSVTLTASAGSSYIWLNGAAQVGTGATYTASTSGNYTVEVSNASNCKAVSSPVSVTVNPLPAAVITAGGSTTFTQGGNVVLSANTGTGLTYQWFNGTSQVGIGSTYTVTTSGSYTAEVSTASNCQLTSNTIVVTVNANQPSVINIISPTDHSTVSGTSVVISATATDPDGGITLVEYLDGTTVIGTSTTEPYTFTWNNPPTGSHDISVRVTDSNGGVTTSTTSTFIVQGPTGLLAGSGYSAFNVYPNPSTDVFTFKVSQEIKNLWIFDLYGVQVGSMEGLQAGQQVEVGKDLPDGAFMLLIKYTSERMEVVKLIKSK